MIKCAPAGALCLRSPAHAQPASARPAAAAAVWPSPAAARAARTAVSAAAPWRLLAPCSRRAGASRWRPDLDSHWPARACPPRSKTATNTHDEHARKHTYT